MLLFQKRFHAGLQSGAVSVTFRRWKKTHVKPGGRYRCHPIGVLVVDSVELVQAKDITATDAESSGFRSRDELMEYLASGPAGELQPSSTVFRVTLHHGGDGDRVEGALDDLLTPEDIDAIDQKLARMDASEPWTRKTLRLIEKNPRIAASQLAAKLGRETLPFKVDVRKLKRLGLTQSFEVGYEVSPRGRAFLAARPKRAPRKNKEQGTRNKE
jgi:hypothetical protein